MPILNSLLSWVMKKRIHQIGLFMKYPSEVQDEWLDRLLASSFKTEWGRKYDYKSIRSLREYKERVPVQDYEDIKPYVKRLQKGEEDLLWPGETIWFAKSSGTTNDKSKFIPVTKEALEECHFKGGKDMLSIYCNNTPDTQIFNGKGLMLGGSSQLLPGHRDSYSGDLSSIIINNLPFWADLFKTPDTSISLMHNWEEKLDKIAHSTLNEDVTNIAGVPSWMLKMLHKILEFTDAKTVMDVWPNLEVYFHGAVNFEPYRLQYDEIIGKKINYLELYNASEGFFGIQDQSRVSEMLLMLDYGIYYEFIPMNELDRDHPNTLSLEEVEIGKNYAMVISTNAGLWRYKIGDTIQFTSLSPFRIIVSGRTKHFINAFGEEVIIDNADRSISIACERTNSRISDYTAAPIYLTNKSAGGHEWLIEFEKEPENLENFAQILDEALKSVNSDYEAKRTGDIALKMPVIQSVKRNTFYNWLKHKNRLGGQNKVPRLSNERKILEELKSFACEE
ncbi:MAG TPA: hypothetical protein DCX54_07845 [Flavobacteriales bacterium]|nr:hypothetical protein [Flavobacteriales bacterium]